MRNYFDRFVEALKHQLKVKVGNKGKQLPALCCCGETLWETNPDTCANNCVFYRNHRGIYTENNISRIFIFII